MKPCHITNITETIISGYGAKPNSISVEVMKHDMRSTCINYKKMEIECIVLTKYSYRVVKKGQMPYYLFACKSVVSEIS